ncbi:hypothetical protein V8C86DRAFT_2775533 [Haematococcus lacustris]
MVLLSLWKPGRDAVERLQRECDSLDFNYAAVGATSGADPTTLQAAVGEGWTVDHRRCRVGYGYPCFEAAKALLLSWGQFQLGWAEVSPSTSTAPAAPVVVVAKSLCLWSANPLRIVYQHQQPPAVLPQTCQKRLSHHSRPSASSHRNPSDDPPHQQPSPHLSPTPPPPSSLLPHPSQSLSLHTTAHTPALPPLTRPMPALPHEGAPSGAAAGCVVQRQPHSWQMAQGCLSGHLLAGEESFRLQWDPLDDSVWYEVLTFSRPAHPLAHLTYPLVRFYQERFGHDSADAMVQSLKGYATSVP